MTDHLVQTLADATAPELVTELPGPEARRVIEQDLAVTSPSMPRVYPLVPRRAEGCVIEDVDGNRFLDLNAGIAVTATGHCHPAVVAAIEEQAGRMLHYCSSDFYHPVYSELCQRLAALAPFGGAPARVFLGNSGTEAVEAAIKLARHHTGRAHLVAFLGGFHGRTMGSLSLTASKARYRAGFGPLLPGVQHVPYGMAGLEQLQTQLFRHLVSPEEVAAIVVEPVQAGTCPRPTASSPACGRSATSTGSSWWPTRCRAGSAAPGSSGPSSTTASSRTSSSPARGWPAACPSAPSSPGLT
jgi:4-aminobutyrate aminotransferase